MVYIKILPAHKNINVPYQNTVPTDTLPCYLRNAASLVGLQCMFKYSRILMHEFRFHNTGWLYYSFSKELA